MTAAACNLPHISRMLRKRFTLEYIHAHFESLSIFFVCFKDHLRNAFTKTERKEKNGKRLKLC